MPASLRELRHRIRSVSSTKQITKAMELVAASKLRKAIQAAQESVTYLHGLEATLGRLLSFTDPELQHPLLTAPTGKRVVVIAISSNQGLAGSYNSAIAKLAQEHGEQLKAAGKQVTFLPLGRKVEGVLRRHGQHLTEHEFVHGREPEFSDIKDAAAYVISSFVEGGYDRIDLVSTEYVSGLTQEARVSTLLPLARPEAREAGDLLVEPSYPAVLEQLLAQVVGARLYFALCQSYASEQASRRRAMHSATDNAGTLIEGYRLQSNRVRQGAITNEIAEITGGAAAIAR